MQLNDSDHRVGREPPAPRSGVTAASVITTASIVAMFGPDHRGALGHASDRGPACRQASNFAAAEFVDRVGGHHAAGGGDQVRLRSSPRLPRSGFADAVLDAGHRQLLADDAGREHADLSSGRAAHGLGGEAPPCVAVLASSPRNAGAGVGVAGVDRPPASLSADRRAPRRSTRTAAARKRFCVYTPARRPRGDRRRPA